MKKVTKLFLIIFIGAILGIIIYLIYPYFQARQLHHKLKKDVIVEEEDDGNDERYIDWPSLKALNPDIVAWIDFEKEPAIIDYPVLYRRDDRNYYLHRSYTGEYQYAGSIFIDSQCHSDFLDNNTILYGHNMNDRSMFANLRNYLDPAFAKENNIFFIYTPDGYKRTYEIFSVMHTNTSNKCYSYVDGTEEDFKAFLNDINTCNILSSDAQISLEDSIVSLSTCDNRSSNGRIVVQGKLVEMKQTQ